MIGWLVNDDDCSNHVMSVFIHPSNDDDDDDHKVHTGFPDVGDVQFRGCTHKSPSAYESPNVKMSFAGSKLFQASVFSFLFCLLAA